MAKDWRECVEAQVRRFTKDTGVSRAKLAEALGLYPAGLYHSHLSDPKRGEEHRNRILFALGGHSAFTVADRLGLDDRGLAALRKLGVALYRDVLGVEIDSEGPRATLREALELARIADMEYDRDQWDIAVPRLRRAWGVLTQEAPSETTQRATLRVGMQLAAWHSAQGDTAEAMGVVKRLLAFSRTYRGADPEMLRQIGNLHLTAAMADRHQGLASPADVIRRLARAEELYRAGADPVDGRVGALRDMAKPYMAWGLGWRGRQPDTDRVRDAHGAARESELLAGGDEPPPERQVGWLFSRFTRIELLALDPHETGGNAARRLWDDALARDWAAGLLAVQTPTALKAKRDFAGMALALACGDLGELATRANDFRAAPANAGYQDRVTRAGRIVELATAGDVAALRTIFLK